MRVNPKEKYHNLPCSYVAVGCAYEDLRQSDFKACLPDKLRTDGYLSLNDQNAFIRANLPVMRRKYFKKNDRILLKDFLKENKKKCIICVLGHYLYADGKEYYSFFDNANDEVVCIWYLNE